MDDNAENWYGKDAPAAKAMFASVKYGASFGFIMYKAGASLYGIGSLAAQSAGITGFITGSAIGLEIHNGFETYTVKKYFINRLKEFHHDNY